MCIYVCMGFIVRDTQTLEEREREREREQLRVQEMEETQQRWDQEQEQKETLRNSNHNTTAAAPTTPRTSVSNGNCADNANTFQTSVTANGAKDSCLDQEQRPEELKFSTNGTATVTDKQGSENCVYYDKDSGIWKCRDCCWTYKNGSVCIDHNQDSKGHLHMLMSGKSVNQRGPYFIYDTKGSGFTYGFSGIQHNSVDCFASDKIHGDDKLDVAVQNLDIESCLSTVINHKNEEKLKEDSLSGSRLRPSEISFEETNAGCKSSNNKALESANLDLIKESDLEITELDVERVLKEQDTHDLYCPNCNSCITRRVIIRKRKRKVRTSSEDVKRNKLETIVGSELRDDSAPLTNNQGHDAVNVSLDSSTAPALNNYDHDRAPDLFRCLSCFSFFIPTGNGFKLFRIFGNKSEKKDMRDRQQIPTVNKNWFPSILASDKGKMLIEQGSSSRADAEKNSVGAIISSSNLKDQKSQPSSVQEAPSPPQTSVFGGLVTIGITEHQEGGGDIATSSTQGSALLEKVMLNVGEKLDDAMKKNKGEAVLDHSEVNIVNQLNSSSFSSEVLPNYENDRAVTIIASRTSVDNGEPAENANLIPQQDGMKLVIPSNMESLILEKSQTDQKLGVEIRKKSSGGKETTSSLLEPVSELGESDLYGKVNILKDIPRKNEKNFGATGFSETVYENGNVIFKNNDKDGLYSSEVTQHNIITTKTDIHTEESLKVDRRVTAKDLKDTHEESGADGFYSSEVTQHNIITTKVDIHTEESLTVDRRVITAKDLKDIPEESGAGKDTIITIQPGPFESAARERAQNIITPAESGSSPHAQTQIRVLEQRGTEAREVRKLDIIKSIVYGGLMESITSLGVVSSAVGADAATLNVLSLGLANLIGGLFIISHDLWELKSNRTEGVTDQVIRQVDRYQELLGRRENFLLHASVAVSSFLLFGLVPPVIYGFSFRKSNDKDLKLVAVAAASLLCIIILATGKAYTRRSPRSYLKTIIYYVIIGFMVSGVSYAFGNLIKKLVEKLGFFQSSSVVTMFLPETMPMNPASAWASY